MLSSLSQAFSLKCSSSPTYEHMHWPTKVSNILQTFVKFSKNLSGKRSKLKLFHTQVFHKIRKTKRTKVVLQPSPSWEVTWRRHDHNALLIGGSKTPFYWLIRDRTKLKRRTQLQRYICIGMPVLLVWVLMFLSTSSRETSGLSGKQN